MLKHTDTVYNVHNITNLFVSSSMYSFPMAKLPKIFSSSFKNNNTLSIVALLYGSTPECLFSNIFSSLSP